MNPDENILAVAMPSERCQDDVLPPQADQIAEQLHPLRRSFAWAFAGNSFYGFCQWGMLTILARLGQSEQVGTYALGISISTPIFMLSNLQLREIQSTDARHEFEFGECVGLRITTTLVAMLAVSAISYLAGFTRRVALVVLLVAMVRAVESLADVFYGLLQRSERLDRISKSLVLHGSLLVLGLGGVFWLKRDLSWAIAFSALGGALALFYDVKSPRLVGEANSPWRVGLRRNLGWTQSVRRLAALGLPLGSVMALVTLSASIPRYFIEKYYGPGELGIFAVMAYFMLVGTLVVTAVGQSASSGLARYFWEGNRTAFVALLRKLVTIAVVLGFVGVAIAALAAGPLLKILYGPEYAVHSSVLVWLMVASGISYVVGFFGFAMTAMRKLRLLFPIFLFASAVSFLGCFLFVPRLGLIGAALAIIASTIAQFVGTAAVVFATLARPRRDRAAPNACVPVASGDQRI